MKATVQKDFFVSGYGRFEPGDDASLLPSEVLVELEKDGLVILETLRALTISGEWSLKISPQEYLVKYPEGPNADTARRLIENL